MRNEVVGPDIALEGRGVDAREHVALELAIRLEGIGIGENCSWFGEGNVNCAAHGPSFRMVVCLRG